jgi:cellulose biosynthesis protein BcsQ
MTATNPAENAIRSPGEVITFYSYKGGTGRSLALSNVAWLLAANGRRVLVIDWDLEAPGLHRYFLPFLSDPELSESPGLIDLLWDYVNLVLTPRDNWPSSISVPFELAEIANYRLILDNPFTGNGWLHLLPAGRQGTEYADQFRRFDWHSFYERQGGQAFIDTLLSNLKGLYDFVLIDSRTGVADTSGICTVALPDTVVLAYTYNRQSVKGIAAVAMTLLVTP